MEKNPNKLTDVSVPQSVTELIKLQTGQETIKIGFTNQKISPHAGLSTLAGFLHWHKFKSVLSQAMPRRSSPNATPTADMALAFMVGIMSGAKKLTQVAYLRADALLPGVFDLSRIGSQSTFTRFFQSFKTARLNTECFDSLWKWCLQRLASKPGGYTLDLDSTTLLHEDAHGREGVQTGHTPQGPRRCYNPLLAVLAEIKLVVGFWLRPGNVKSGNNAVGFTIELLHRLPSYVRIGLVRADSGFCENGWLDLLEQRRLPYIVVGRIHHPLARLIRKSTVWKPTRIEGIEVADETFQAYGWEQARRVVLIRHRLSQRPNAGGRELIDWPDYKYQALITNLPLWVGCLEVWFRYNGRGDTENVIKELDASFALPELSLKGFYATEAAMVLAVMSYNVVILFQRNLGWLERVTTATLRFLLFTTAGIISRTAGYTTVRLAVPPGPRREWWRTLWEKTFARYGNCNAVESCLKPTPA